MPPSILKVINLSATMSLLLGPCVVVLLGFLLLFLALLEKGRLETPTIIYKKNTRGSKSLHKYFTNQNSEMALMCYIVNQCLYGAEQIGIHSKFLERGAERTLIGRTKYYGTRAIFHSVPVLFENL